MKLGEGAGVTPGDVNSVPDKDAPAPGDDAFALGDDAEAVVYTPAPGDDAVAPCYDDVPLSHPTVG